MATNREAAREARLEAAKAARATAPKWVEVDTTVGEITVGDYLVLVPTQMGLRGTRFDGLVTRADSTWQSYGLRTGPRRPLTPVEAIWLGTALVQGATAYPASFTCTVRRAV